MIFESAIESNRRTIRVDIRKLQEVSRQLNELIAVLAGIARISDRKDDSLPLDRLGPSLDRLSQIADGIRETVNSLRKVDLSGTFRRSRRLVRALAVDAGKKVELEINEIDIELDKHVVDLIDDSLMHAIRNAIDHGLESPDARESAGKSSVGRITVDARGIGSDVVISISDDGQGLDRNKIVRKAIELGLISESQADLPEGEIWRLTLLPGFSTVDRVTLLSGRGVGMQAIQENMAKINGKVEIRSQSGKGTTVILRIPQV